MKKLENNLIELNNLELQEIYGGEGLFHRLGAASKNLYNNIRCAYRTEKNN